MSRASEVWTIIALTAMLLVDGFFAFKNRNKKTTIKAASLMTLLYVAVAIGFGLAMSAWTDPQSQQAFFAGWITEYSLSMDNLFVFILIFARLQVAEHKQEIVLLWGIAMSLFLRGIFLLGGVALVERWAFMLFIFGAFLVYTGIEILRESDEDEWNEGRLIRYMKKKDYSVATIALIAIAVANLMFAFDSIPAIIGITHDMYVILCANFFALMGLRQLYFLVEALMHKLYYLSLGLAVILIFIGAKLFFEALHSYDIDEVAGVHVPEISLVMSLSVIILILAGSAGASLIRKQKPHTPI